MQKVPILLPNPRKLKFTEGICNLQEKKVILLSNHPQSLLFSATRLKNALTTYHYPEMEIHASNSFSILYCNALVKKLPVV